MVEQGIFSLTLSDTIKEEIWIAALLCLKALLVWDAVSCTVSKAAGLCVIGLTFSVTVLPVWVIVARCQPRPQPPYSRGAIAPENIHKLSLISAFSSLGL